METITPANTERLSQSSFNEGIKVLADLFQSYNLDDDTHKGILHKWKMKQVTFPQMNRYLYHPPFFQRIIYCEKNDVTQNDNSGDIESEHYNDNIMGIEDNAVVSINNNEQLEKYHDIEWSFSIVYSSVWSVPVLYFQVQFSTGVLMTRDEVLKILQRQPGTKKYDNDVNFDNNDDGWNFVSQEEHPITGVPAFFLHPCQSANRMNLLYKENQHEVRSNPGKWILSWMSMILPSVGFQLSPKLFQKL